MIIVRTPQELRQALASSDRPAFVPTMGNLHEGHLRLVRLAREQGDRSVASIFVNRLQFLPHEDFDSYPRTFEADCAKLEAEGCDVLFAPVETDLYPEPQTVKVHADPALADMLEGQFRPGFFTGVSTVVLKLFMSVFAGKAQGVAVFGKKDYQQLMVIRRMVQQMALPIEIIGGDTERADDGLALSSRNGYLSAPERTEAVQLSLALKTMIAQTKAGLRQGQLNTAAIEEEAMQRLRARGWQPDYMTLRHQHDLSPVTGPTSEPLVVLAAARLGKTRLIDNMEV